MSLTGRTSTPRSPRRSMVTPAAALAMPLYVAWPAPRTAMGTSVGRFRRRAARSVETSSVEVGLATAADRIACAGAVK
ncbi:hypothetical protein VM1G_11969 [Cytospora mali]|uniref:Uncharacterized protein n=1 Tax=Cytospora mali TaxID=578113 RepID=A0A194WCN9_CYTMA|nr:hypothetical protein VM1G_11969 [Valsa mali]